MKLFPRDTKTRAEDYILPAVDDASADDEGLLDRSGKDMPNNYRVWRLNGVSIGVRIHKKNN